MSNLLVRNLVWSLTALLLLIHSLQACGPFFPNRVLVEGDDYVLKAPVAGFQKEIERIQPPVPTRLKAVVPKLLRTGIRHVFSNLDEPLVFANDILQLKPKRAARTFARFVINSSVGVGGVFDVAVKADLPHHPNGFGDTLGRYGVGPGPYLFIPFVGPTDLRDLFGDSADNALLPAAVGFPFDRKEFTIPRSVVTGIDLRAESDADLKALYAGAADRYATLRSVYLQSRVAEIDEIRHGTATPKLDDPLLDPGAGTTPATTPGAPDTADPLTDPAKAPPASMPTVGNATIAPATPAAGTAPPAPDMSDPLTDPAKATAKP